MADSERPEKTIDVFISYSRRDKAVADRVYQKVTQRGLSAFYDTRSIDVGENWREELYNAIIVSRTMIPLISRNSLDSSMVKLEINKALNYGIQICPVLIGKVDRYSKLCRFVDEYHWLESNEPPTDQELDLLVEGVAAFVSVDRKMPQIALLAPKGGATFRPGDTCRLAWEISAVADTEIRQIGMELLQNGLSVYAFPGKDSPWAGSVRECDWTVPSSIPAGKFTLRMHAISNLGHVASCETDAPIVIESRVPQTVEEVLPPEVPAAQTEELKAAEPSVAVVEKPQPVEAPVLASLQVREPSPHTRWTREGIRLVHVELTAADKHGLMVELVSPSNPPRTVVTLNELELRGKISPSGDGRSAMIPVTIPISQPFGKCVLRTSLTTATGGPVSPVEVPIEVIPSAVSSRVSDFEQEECIGTGVSFAALCAVLAVGGLLLQQCYPVVKNAEWKQLDVSEFCWQLAEAAGAILWQNLFIVPLTAVIGGVLIAEGWMIWKGNVCRWLGGLMIGIGWGGGVGLGLSILNSEGPKPPVKLSWTYNWARPSNSDVEDLSPTKPSRRLGLDKNDPNPGPRSLKVFQEGGKLAEEAVKPSPDEESTPPPAIVQPTPLETTPDEVERRVDAAKDLNHTLDKLNKAAWDAEDAQFTEESKVWHKATDKLNLSYLFWCALIGAAIGLVSPLLEE